MLRVLGNTSCDLDLVNDSSPEPLDIATSKFTGA